MLLYCFSLCVSSFSNLNGSLSPLFQIREQGPMLYNPEHSSVVILLYLSFLNGTWVSRGLVAHLLVL